MQVMKGRYLVLIIQSSLTTLYNKQFSVVSYQHGQHVQCSNGTDAKLGKGVQVPRLSSQLNPIGSEVAEIFRTKQYTGIHWSI